MELTYFSGNKKNCATYGKQNYTGLRNKHDKSVRH